MFLFGDSLGFGFLYMSEWGLARRTNLFVAFVLLQARLVKLDSETCFARYNITGNLFVQANDASHFYILKDSVVDFKLFMQNKKEHT